MARTFETVHFRDPWYRPLQIETTPDSGSWADFEWNRFFLFGFETNKLAGFNVSFLYFDWTTSSDGKGMCALDEGPGFESQVRNFRFLSNMFVCRSSTGISLTHTIHLHIVTIISQLIQIRAPQHAAYSAPSEDQQHWSQVQPGLVLELGQINFNHTPCLLVSIQTHFVFFVLFLSLLIAFSLFI